MKLKFPIIGYIRDVDGIPWDIRDARDTKHGFDLCFGTPNEDHGAFKGGLPRLIATQALWDFWELNCLIDGGLLFDLPAGRTTLKRMRRRLGFNFDLDMEEFWQKRLGDLATLTPRDFAKKHGVTKNNASDRRTRMIGIRARPFGWWRKPAVLDVLRSDLNLRQTGERLVISTSQVFRLRLKVRLMDAEVLAALIEKALCYDVKALDLPSPKCDRS